MTDFRKEAAIIVSRHIQRPNHPQQPTNIETDVAAALRSAYERGVEDAAKVAETTAGVNAGYRAAALVAENAVLREALGGLADATFKNGLPADIVGPWMNARKALSTRNEHASRMLAVVEAAKEWYTADANNSGFEPSLSLLALRAENLAEAVEALVTSPDMADQKGTDI